METTKRWNWPLPIRADVATDVPTGEHAGAFGTRRKYDVHSGVDLYCEPGVYVGAVEAGTVVALEIFTGRLADSPWWHETYAVYVEGASGVVVYGEVKPTVEVGQGVSEAEPIGRVMTVLTKDKGLPMTMLHLELHKPGTKRTESWKLDADAPATLLDPTEFLLNAKK